MTFYKPIRESNRYFSLIVIIDTQTPMTKVKIENDKNNNKNINKFQQSVTRVGRPIVNTLSCLRGTEYYPRYLVGTQVL